MLAIDKPLGLVSELALFGDHADPQRVYVAPTRPALARDANGAQEISFVKFRSQQAADGGIGLLSFTTELVASEAQLAAAREHLERQGVSDAQLVTVPWIAGKAVFAAALREGDGFVERLLGEVTPDLAAGNRALFSLVLSEEGARLVEALVHEDGPCPLGVRYELQYAGLRPALAVRIVADYRRAYQELSWGLQFGVAYEGVGVRASVESATQRLIEAGALQIEVTQFSDAAELRAHVDEAVKWLQEQLLEDFFETRLQPASHEDLLARAVAAATRLGASSLQQALGDATQAASLARELGLPVDQLAGLAKSGAAGSAAGGAAGGATGGASSTFALKLQFSLRDIDQEELKTLHFDWTEARAEKRTAAPQGLLSRLGAPPRVIEASDSGDFWDRLSVTVRPLGDFAALGVQRLLVQLAFPDEDSPTAQESLRFEPGRLAPARFDAWTDGAAPRYRARTDVHFDEQGPWPGPPIFTGAWHTLQSLELGVHPLSEVPRLEVEIAPGTLVFADMPQVQVDLRLDGHLLATHMLTEAAKTARFRWRLAPLRDEAPHAGMTDDVADIGAVVETMPTPRGLESRNTWFLAGGTRVEGEWQPVEATTLLVHAPWRSTRTLRLVPLLPEDLIEALLTLTVQEAGRTHTVEVRFEAGDRRTRTVSIPCLSAVPPPVQVDVLVIRGDGSSFVAAPVTTDDPVLIVRDRDGQQRQVGVRLLAGPDLAVHGVMAVQVQLLAGDVAEGPEESVLDSVVFTPSRREPGRLLVPVDADAPAPRVRVIRYALDGTARIARCPPRWSAARSCWCRRRCRHRHVPSRWCRPEHRR